MIAFAEHSGLSLRPLPTQILLDAKPEFSDEQERIFLNAGKSRVRLAAEVLDEMWQARCVTLFKFYAGTSDPDSSLLGDDNGTRPRLEQAGGSAGPAGPASNSANVTGSVLVTASSRLSLLPSLGALSSVGELGLTLPAELTLLRSPSPETHTHPPTNSTSSPLGANGLLPQAID